MPNTEVKLSSAENTWMETSWEDREVLAFVYSPIAQSVERVTVNHDVAGGYPFNKTKKGLHCNPLWLPLLGSNQRHHD